MLFHEMTLVHINMPKIMAWVPTRETIGTIGKPLEKNMLFRIEFLHLSHS